VVTVCVGKTVWPPGVTLFMTILCTQRVSRLFAFKTLSITSL